MLIWRVITDFVKDKEYRELLITSVVVLAVGTVIFHYLEGWSYLDSLYFLRYYAYHYWLWRFSSRNGYWKDI
jgi:hypothetical protein